jgi:hypothetical protein
MATKFNIIKVAWAGEGGRRKVSGPHKWTVAWRQADKLNKQAMKDFKEGRIMYDVPIFEVEEIKE